MKKWIVGIIGVIAVVILIFAWWTLSPLFLDKRVDEQAPVGDISAVEFQGSFIDADSFHKTSGTAKVITVDGKTVLSLEDFETTNGPDLYIYLATDTSASDFIELGELKGNIGNQNYDIVEDIDLSNHKYVLIWCQAFSTLFGSAELNLNT